MLEITTDITRMDVALIHQHLTTSYWSPEIPIATVERAIQNSMCFAGFSDGAFAAFARVITDTATFAYLADVLVVPEMRGKGFGKALVAFIMAHPDVQGLRRFLLATRDAHGLYEGFGFKAVAKPETFMEILRADVYRADTADIFEVRR